MKRFLICFVAMFALQACDKPAPPKSLAVKAKTVDPRGSHFPATYGQEFSPGNMWDELLLEEEALAKAQPGLFQRDHETLTVFRDGKPFAEFKEASTDNDFAVWRIAGTVELFDSETKGTMTVYRLIRGGIEYSEDVILDPKGRLYAMGQDIQISPDHRMIAAGRLSDWSPAFSLIDWAGRKIYAVDLWCQTVTWESNTRARIACAANAGPPAFQAVTIEKSGNAWKFQPIGYYELTDDGDESDIFSGKASFRAADNLASITAKVEPLKDDTEFFSKLGYRFLGGN